MQDKGHLRHKKARQPKKFASPVKLRYSAPSYFFFAFFRNCNTSPSLGCVPSSIRLSL